MITESGFSGAREGGAGQKGREGRGEPGENSRRHFTTTRSQCLSLEVRETLKYDICV